MAHKYEHFAIGLMVSIREGARPLGWANLINPEDTDWLPETGRRHRYQVQSIWPATKDDPTGSVEVMGWAYAPEDLISE